MIKVQIQTFLLFCFQILLIFPLLGTSKDLVQEAKHYSQIGESTTDYEERKHALNQALYLYNLLQKDKKYSFSTSLNQALGNTYFQLGEYAWSILYYQRALKLDPVNPPLISQLEKTQQMLGVPFDSLSTPQSSWLTYYSNFNQKYYLLFCCFVFTLLICSLAIWLPYQVIRFAAIGMACLLMILSAIHLYSYYSTPIEGIVVKTSGIFRAPDLNQPQLTNIPLLAGTKVKILQITENEDWIKITNSKDVIGYIPINHVRLI